MLAIALIPSLALLITSSVVVTNLAGEANRASQWSSQVSAQLQPLFNFPFAVSNERTLSLAAVEGDPRAVAGLQAARAATDAGMITVKNSVPAIDRPGSEGLADRETAALNDISARLPLMRQSIDVRHAALEDVDAFYSGMIIVLADGLADLANDTNDATSAAQETASAELVRMTDMHSRAVAVASALVAGSPTAADRRFLAELSGAYRLELTGMNSELTPDSRARVQAMTASPAWRTATDAENGLAEHGVLPIALSDWQAAEATITNDLLGIFGNQVQYANSLVTAASHRTMVRTILAGIGTGVIAIVAFVLAMLLSNRLVRRLRLLRSGTLQLANETLPSIITRLRDGEHVDIDSEAEVLDRGADEIGQVAAAFAAAQRTAMGLAAAETRTREGFNKVFVDIAHRSQVLVRRQMDVLDIAEEKQDDPEHLELLFRLDHLATRARRNAENLLILGGEQPGRRWHEPVSLEEIVRSAASESQDFSRISAIRMPAVSVLGSAVADVIHLLAELIDNATLFSPPQTTVSVQGVVVGRGTVIEIEDQGLGIEFDERARLNELLQNPPDFNEMALAGQRNLGLFVVGRLATRHNITVNLQNSAYGGVKAIVLIPSKILDSGDAHDHAGTATIRGRRPDGSPRPVEDPVPRRPDGNSQTQFLPWTTDQPNEPAQQDSVTTTAGARPAVVGRGPAGAAKGGTTPRKRAPLPRRQRLTHLAPQLRWDDDEDSIEDPVPAEQTRSADDVRQAMASFQRGTRLARESTPPTDS